MSRRIRTSLLAIVALSSHAVASPVEVGPPAPAPIPQQVQSNQQHDLQPQPQPQPGAGQPIGPHNQPGSASPQGLGAGLTTGERALIARVNEAETQAPLGAGKPEIRKDWSGWAWDTWLALAGVVGVIVLLSMVMKRSARAAGLVGALGPGGPSPSGLLAVLGRYPVGPRQQIVLLRAHDRVLLIDHEVGRLGRGGGAMRMLYAFEEPEAVADLLARTKDESTDRVAGRFRELVGRFAAPQSEAAPDHTSAHRRRVIHDSGDIVELLDDSDGGYDQGDDDAFEENQQQAPVSIDSTAALSARLDAMRARDAYRIDSYQPRTRVGEGAW